MTRLSTAGSPNREDFPRAAATALLDLHHSFAGVVEALPGRVSRGHEVHKTLRIDRNLGWKIAKICQETDLLTIARHMPGQAAVNIFLRAASEQGVAAPLIQKASKALDAFERLIADHAGDRSSLEMMLSSYADAANGQTEIAHRKKAFQGNSFIFGIQAAAQFRCCIAQPGDDPAVLDAATLSGYVSLRRLRHDAPLVVSRFRMTDDAGRPRPSPIREPLDSEADTTTGVALIQKFCSIPVPQFRTIPASAGFVHTELIETGVGHKAASTYVEGRVVRNMATRYRTDDSGVFGLCVGVRIPCEVLLSDLLIREDTYDAISPETATYADPPGEPPYPAPGRERDKLPFIESVTYLGKGPVALRTADVPRYADMAQYAIDRLGWNAERFNAYRCRVAYPVLPSTVVLRFELP